MNEGMVQKPARSGRTAGGPAVPPTTSLTPSLFSQPAAGDAQQSLTPRLDAFNSYQNSILPPMQGIGPTAPATRRLA